MKKGNKFRACCWRRVGLIRFFYIILGHHTDASKNIKESIEIRAKYLYQTKKVLDLPMLSFAYSFVTYMRELQRMGSLAESTGGGFGALTLRPRTIRPPVQFIFSLGGPIDPQRTV